MQSYLPRETGPTSGYSEGGGLYALGLIHANHGTAINDYLLGQLKEAQNEVHLFSADKATLLTRMRLKCIILQVVRHGGALGIGLSAMGTNRMDIYDQLKFNLYQDDAVTGEAASLAMGMLMIGSKSYSVINDMISVILFPTLLISREKLRTLKLQFFSTVRPRNSARENPSRFSRRYFTHHVRSSRRRRGSHQHLMPG